MNETAPSVPSLDNRIASRLKSLRQENRWSLEDVSDRCGISRATLSRIEKGDVSPTATVLGKLCATYATTMSRLMALVEIEFTPHIPLNNQPEWTDSQTGFTRRSVSPPSPTLTAEVLQCVLPAGTTIHYDAPPKPGLEHHLVVLEGALEMAIEGQNYQLKQGDCLRYVLFGSSRFKASSNQPAKYMLFIR